VIEYKENKHIIELMTLLEDVINAHIDSCSLSYAEIIGVLEIIKARVLDKLVEDSDDD